MNTDKDFFRGGEPLSPGSKIPTPFIINYAKGGIGNQLFQHIFAKSLGHKLGLPVYTDDSFYTSDPYGHKAKVWHLDQNCQKLTIESLGEREGFFLLKEGQISSLREIKSLPPNLRYLVLNGYWQGEQYFEREIALQTYASLVQNISTSIDAKLIAQLKSSDNPLAVHIRRRDYGHMGLCRNSYYVAAIRHIVGEFANADIFIFSDEPNFSRHLLKKSGINGHLVASGSDLGDLFLMSLCKHFVISNSSYSWWAAWFGEAQRHTSGGLVIAPKEWVTIDDTPSPCPSRWLQVPNSVESGVVNESEVNAFIIDIENARFKVDLRRWKSLHGDSKLRVNFPELGPNSLVMDLGGHRGLWSGEIVSLYNPRIIICEPLREFYEDICKKFSGNKKVEAFHCGLGHCDEIVEMQNSGDGSGFYAGGKSERVRIREVSNFFAEQGISRVDLLKINIEGGEYDLLDRLIATGLINKVCKLQVQFHAFVPDSISRRSRIVEKLAWTHVRQWNFHFVWEEWCLK